MDYRYDITRSLHLLIFLLIPYTPHILQRFNYLQIQTHRRLTPSTLHSLSSYTSYKAEYSVTAMNYSVTTLRLNPKVWGYMREREREGNVKSGLV